MIFHLQRKTSSGSTSSDMPWRGLTALCFYNVSYRRVYDASLPNAIKNKGGSKS